MQCTIMKGQEVPYLKPASLPTAVNSFISTYDGNVEYSAIFQKVSVDHFIKNDPTR